MVREEIEPSLFLKVFSALGLISILLILFPGDE
jgi:hypothetical protein